LVGFFYCIVAFAALLLPFFISVDGAFSPDRRLFFVVIKLYGIKIVSLKIFFDEKHGIALSVNGKRGKVISERSERGDGKPSRNYLPLLRALILTRVDLTLYAGGKADRISLYIAALNLLLEQALKALPRRPDRCRIEALPCYVNDSMTVKFSIRFFTAIAPLLFAFAHTKRGERNAKRSDRKFDG